MDNQYIVALEIGSSKIVGALAEVAASGQLFIRAVESEQTINCVRYGCIQNVESTKATVNHIIAKLNNHVDGDITSVYVGVAGRTLHSVSMDVKYNLASEQAITNAIINDIMKKACRESFPNYDTIDAVPRSFTIDNREVKDPVGNFASHIVAHITMIVAKPIISINLKRVFSPNMLKGFITLPVALADAMLTEDERTLGCMLVDLGAETTTVSIYRKGALEYLNTIPLGGRNLSLDISALGIREEVAERIKKNIEHPLRPTADPVTIDGIKSSDAANYILARTGEIIANITNQVSNSGLTLSDVRTIVITGGGAMLKGIDTVIAENTGLPVRIISSKPDGINIRTANESRIENFGVYSIMLAAAKHIGNDSCVFKQSYVATPVQPTDTTVNKSPQDEKPPKKQPESGKNRMSWWERMKNRAVDIISEEKENENDNY